MKALFRTQIALFCILSFFFDVVLAQEVRTPEIDFMPRSYVVYKTDSPITINGNLSKPEWEQVPWTEPFLDIQGDSHPAPRHQTKAKMLWDNDYFYFAAKLEEPHIWATKTARDAVIYMDNNFEIFIDPNGDTHNYYEFEVNAKGTFWDLMLTKPYRNGGRAIDAWDIKGIQIGIDLQGTLNDPSDTDTSWTVEVAIPWDVLLEAAPGGMPEEGTQWRVNFSRVQWQTEIVDGEYVKKRDPETGRELPEDNWTWSPQGVINMHFPELWGFVQFSEQPPSAGDSKFEWNIIEDYKWLLRQLYYKQVEYRNEHGYYTNNPIKLNAENKFRSHFDGKEWSVLPEIMIVVLDDNYIMRLSSDDLDRDIYIRNDSKIWTR